MLWFIMYPASVTKVLVYVQKIEQTNPTKICDENLEIWVRRPVIGTKKHRKKNGPQGQNQAVCFVTTAHFFLNFFFYFSLNTIKCLGSGQKRR